jgi:hypothetical protein
MFNGALMLHQYKTIIFIDLRGETHPFYYTGRNLDCGAVPRAARAQPDPNHSEPAAG